MILEIDDESRHDKANHGNGSHHIELFCPGVLQSAEEPTQSGYEAANLYDAVLQDEACYGRRNTETQRYDAGQVDVEVSVGIIARYGERQVQQSATCQTKDEANGTYEYAERGPYLADGLANKVGGGRLFLPADESLGIETSVGSKVDVLEEDAPHGGLDGCPQVACVHLYHALGMQVGYHQEQCHQAGTDAVIHAVYGC